MFKLDSETLAEMDDANRRADNLLLRTQMARAEQAAADEVDLMRKVEALVDARVATAIDEALNDVAQIVGESLKEIDGRFKEITDKLLDNTIEHKARATDQSDKVTRELQSIKRSMSTLLKKIDRVRGDSSNVRSLPLRGHA